MFEKSTTLYSRLRIIESFEGIISREVVQNLLKNEIDKILLNIEEDLEIVETLFAENNKNVQKHKNFPSFSSKLVWAKSLKRRASEPITSLKRCCPQVLESEVGWQLRDKLNKIVNQVSMFETEQLRICVEQ